MASEQIQTSLRLSPELKKRAEELARRQNISINKAVEKLIAEAEMPAEPEPDGDELTANLFRNEKAGQQLCGSLSHFLSSSRPQGEEEAAKWDEAVETLCGKIEANLEERRDLIAAQAGVEVESVPQVTAEVPFTRDGEKRVKVFPRDAKKNEECKPGFLESIL